ncbi:SAPS-domain-containing protein [Cristinia sonorae]|uniref:SAPS-domain-containing protein n=1 Tax=Cristinia sonorae TaxID=1940300 RepID=A0A8K0UZR7_9AGAR|nr:SAPS-domain-containing protein [Cristinia sonorae]
MFWRFGFHNASNIDSLLDKEDVSLEAILDEDDLLQECKAQNTRLIDYFQQVDVLQRLLGYVTGQIEGEERGRFKYPYVSTEVLCSEIWSIVEECINNSERLLTPFWETVLDRSPEDMKTQMVKASHFAKINAVFLSRKPAEMLAFIQSQPDVVQRILRHIETPAFADLLVRIIQLDEHPSGAGVLEWLSKENLMSRLLDFLSPAYTANMHTVVADLIKSIISMAAPTPAAGIADGPGNGPASNRFARELAHRDSVAKLVGYILSDFPAPDSQSTDPASSALEQEHVLPSPESTTSSIVQSICIIIELIRQNNSDYFEPYLFHTLRNRLIQVQQNLHMNTQNGREALEQAMKDMVNRMGVVHLGPVLSIMCDKLEALQKYLVKPRSLNGPVLTTIGQLNPLTFERYRLCELYAELLHASNMSLLNRPSEYDHLYDAEGRLQGGLSSLEELAQVIALSSGSDPDQDGMDDDEGDEMEPAHEFPVSTASHDSVSLTDSDEEMSEPGSSEDDPMEEVQMNDEPLPIKASSSPLPENPLERYPSRRSLAASDRRMNSTDSEGSTQRHRSSSRRSTRRTSTMETITTGSLVLGERLKQRFLEANVASTLLDLFFQFPWNNFLHSVVYDYVHQVLTGRALGYNRELAISLFRDARLFHRIIEGSKHNDIESARPKGVRLGYMGHLTLISEEVITTLSRLPPDLRLLINQYAPQPEWDEYITGRYKETKTKDTILLGGGKPVVAPSNRNGAPQWKVDEADTGGASSSGASQQEGGESEMNGEFRRNARATREASADFGAAPMDDDDDDEDDYGSGAPHFARYLAQEMQSNSENFSSDEASDDDEEDGGWLAQSTFDMRPPPMSARPPNGDRRPLEASGFDDAFDPGPASSSTQYNDPFEDDTFGPFSDSAAASGTDPFTFTSDMSDDITEETSFDSFGEFGDFQSAESIEGPPGGADSWSFASLSSSSSIDDASSIGRMSESPKDSERTARVA